jgi:hypothetical protein
MRKKGKTMNDFYEKPPITHMVSMTYEDEIKKLKKQVKKLEKAMREIEGLRVKFPKNYREWHEEVLYIVKTALKEDADE